MSLPIPAQVKTLLANKYVIVGLIVFVVTSFVWWRMGSVVRRMAVNRAWRQCERRCVDEGKTLDRKKWFRAVGAGTEDEPVSAVERVFDEGDPDLAARSGSLLGPRGLRVLGIIGIVICAWLWASGALDDGPPSTAAVDNPTSNSAWNIVVSNPELEPDRITGAKSAIKTLRNGSWAADSDKLTLSELWKLVTDEELQA